MEVTYIDHMGSDLSVVNAARVSFGKKSDWIQRIYTGEPHVLSEKDARLIRYLAKHNHKSPFNHTFVTFHIKAPVFVARQLVKHEYMPWNEISRRYVDEAPEFYRAKEWRGRSKDKKQGSDGTIDAQGIAPIGRAEWAALECYNILLEKGVAPEQARMVLPQSMMTEWYWSGTLFAFAKMCGLRCKDDTQAETREIANEISLAMQELFPISWEALIERKDNE